MAFISIPVPDSIKILPYADGAESVIDTINEAIEAFLLKETDTIENFVPCDFHLLDQAMTWIEQNHLMAGNRFCEFGSGFGAAAMLAAMRGWTSVGIEIEARLVEQSILIAEAFDNAAAFYHGSFIPRGIQGLSRWATEVNNVDTHDDDVFDEIGLNFDDFDLFFAFPWPGEHEFFESVVDACAADGAMLLTYRGREGMHLLRKVN